LFYLISNRKCRLVEIVESKILKAANFDAKQDFRIYKLERQPGFFWKIPASYPE